MSTVSPGWRGFAVAVVRRSVARAVVAPTVWMVTRARGVVGTGSSPFVFTFSSAFSSSPVDFFPFLIGAGGGGRGCVEAVYPVDLRLGGEVTVSLAVCLCVWMLLCLWVGCLGHHGVVEIRRGVGVYSVTFERKKKA